MSVCIQRSCIMSSLVNQLSDRTVNLQTDEDIEWMVRWINSYLRYDCPRTQGRVVRTIHVQVYVQLMNSQIWRISFRRTLAKTKSNLMPSIPSLSTDTNAFSTASKFRAWGWKKNDNKRIMYIVLWTGMVSLCRRILTCTLIKPTNEVKKSIRSICFGTTHSTSISKFFMCTPRLKEPNWEIYPCVALATSLRIRCKSLLCLSPEIKV